MRVVFTPPPPSGYAKARQGVKEKAADRLTPPPLDSQKPGKVTGSGQLSCVTEKWKVSSKLSLGTSDSDGHRPSSAFVTHCLGLPGGGPTQHLVPSPTSSAKPSAKSLHVTATKKIQNGLIKPRSIGLHRHYWKMVSCLPSIQVCDSNLCAPSPPASTCDALSDFMDI